MRISGDPETMAVPEFFVPSSTDIEQRPAGHHRSHTQKATVLLYYEDPRCGALATMSCRYVALLKNSAPAGQSCGNPNIPRTAGISFQSED
jgi:hypothetical protein